MNAKELRIGNYIDIINRNSKVHLPFNSVMCVFAIDPFDVSLFKQGVNPSTLRDIPVFKVSDITPIPITEEWLLRFGVDNDYTIDIKCGRKKISFRWYSRVISSGKRHGFTSEKYPHIKHVHQLQNLYFALTGEELTIKQTP